MHVIKCIRIGGDNVFKACPSLQRSLPHPMNRVGIVLVLLVMTAPFMERYVYLEISKRSS